MKPGKIYIKRLEKLRDHLLHGKLSVDKFAFYCCRAETSCGTLGCALGECVALWPKQFQFDFTCYDNTDTIKYYHIGAVDGAVDGDNIDTDIFDTDILLNWFGIDYYEKYHLFYPAYQDTKKYGGKILHDNATKEKVANNITEFLNRMIPTL